MEDKAREKPGGRGALLFFVLLVVVAITRAPFYSMTLAGEEGEFGRSVVMVDQGHLPRGIIARTSHGSEFAIPAGHNLGGYLLPAALLWPAMHANGFTSLEQRRRIAIALRMCISLIYGLAMVLALALLDEGNRPRGAALLAAFSLPALPLLGSVQVNYDGAISTFLVVAALFCARRSANRSQLAWSALAGLVLSFGKIEFAIALFAAIVLSDLLANRWKAVPALIIGFAAGELTWRFVDPVNFNYGIGLVTRYWAMQGAGGSARGSLAWTYAQTHLALLWPVYAAAAFVFAYIVLRRRGLSLAPAALTLAFILVGYHAIAWRGDGFPRYFGPCFPLAAVLLAELELPAAFGYAAAALLVAVAMPGYAHLLGNREHALASVIHSTRDDLEMARQLEQDPRSCVTVTDMDSGIGFYSRTASFACCGSQWSDWVGEHGGRVCRF